MNVEQHDGSMTSLFSFQYDGDNSLIIGASNEEFGTYVDHELISK
jgi:hypothetical protein